jgi:DNA-binding transcriptional ArsR family regulator
MAGLLPSSPDVEQSDEPRVVGLDSADADELIEALSSATTREVLAALHEEPAAASELADRVDTSLQNVQYHLGKLEDAGLVEVGDTIYSEKGREMDIYVPADRALVVVAGQDEETTGLKTALSRLLGGIGVLGVASVVVDRLARGGIRLPIGGTGGADAGGGGGDGGESADADAGADGAAETPEPEVSGDAGAATETAMGADAGGTTVAEEATPTEIATETTTPAATGTPAETAAPAATGAPTETATPAATPSPAPEPMTEVATETATTTPRPTAVPTEAVETTAAAAQPGLLDGVVASPGVVFFLGGATVLVGGFALWWLRQ